MEFVKSAKFSRLVVDGPRTDLVYLPRLPRVAIRAGRVSIRVVMRSEDALDHGKAGTHPTDAVKRDAGANRRDL